MMPSGQFSKEGQYSSSENALLEAGVPTAKNLSAKKLGKVLSCSRKKMRFFCCRHVLTVYCAYLDQIYLLRNVNGAIPL